MYGLPKISATTPNVKLKIHINTALYCQNMVKNTRMRMEKYETHHQCLGTFLKRPLPLPDFILG